MSSCCPGRRLASHVRRLAQIPLCELVGMFGAWVSFPEPFFRPIRRRVFTAERTFWLFLSQMLSPDPSCRAAVQKALAWLAVTNGPEVSPDTSAYCQARQRLHDQGLKAVSRQVVETVESKTSKRWLWRGHRVKVADGSSFTMPDTRANQQVWPQPSGQKRGCGFPFMRVVVLFSLATGVLIDLAEGSLRLQERTLLRRLRSHLLRGDVLLADRGFCGFADYWALLQLGVHSVTRQHQRLKFGVGLRRVQRLHRNDWLVEWRRSPVPSQGYDRAGWAALPETLTVRQITVRVAIPGFRTEVYWLLTTLVDPKAYPARAFAELYRRRWAAELFLRDIKITLAMNPLRCKTPALIRKELLMHQIAYNLVRAVMIDAARTAHVAINRVSFKAAVTTIRQWTPQLARIRPAKRRNPLYRRLLSALARDLLPKRPNRVEPRALKRRPKEYQRLNKPRHLFQEIHHRNRYHKTTHLIQ